MRFFFAAAFLGLAATVSAQLPSCATPCITGADLDGCQPTDNSCLCKSQKFVSSTTTCVQSSCQGDELTQALKASQELCEKVGITLTASSAAASATSPSSGSSVAASATSAAASATSAAASASTTPNAASVYGINGAAALAALGLSALVL